MPSSSGSSSAASGGRPSSTAWVRRAARRPFSRAAAAASRPSAVWGRGLEDVAGLAVGEHGHLVMRLRRRRAVVGDLHVVVEVADLGGEGVNQRLQRLAPGRQALGGPALGAPARDDHRDGDHARPQREDPQQDVAAGTRRRRRRPGSRRRRPRAPRRRRPPPRAGRPPRSSRPPGRRAGSPRSASKACCTALERSGEAIDEVARGQHEDAARVAQLRRAASGRRPAGRRAWRAAPRTWWACPWRRARRPPRSSSARSAPDRPAPFSTATSEAATGARSSSAGAEPASASATTSATADAATSRMCLMRGPRSTLSRTRPDRLAPRGRRRHRIGRTGPAASGRAVTPRR